MTSLTEPVALSSMPLDSTALHPHWPAPSNPWTPGARQCARCCKTCQKGQWQISDKQIGAHFRVCHVGVPQLQRLDRSWLVEETAWCVKGFDAEGLAIIGHRRDGGAPWMPAQAAKRTRVTTALRPDDQEAAQLAAARTYELALTQMSLLHDETQRATRTRLDAVQQLLSSDL